jgi:ion channel
LSPLPIAPGILGFAVDSVARVVIAAVGIWIVLSVLYDLLVSVVLPRPAPGRWRVTNIAFRLTWRPYRWVGVRLGEERRERLLGAYAPGMVILVLIIWVALLVSGYGLVLWSIREQVRPELPSLGSAIYFSGVSLLTIGFGDFVPVGPLARAVSIVEAGTGLGTVALVISMLFSLYGNFMSREALVITLDASAGAPPSGMLLLESARKLKMPELLDQTFAEWRKWAAELLDSHLAYPQLNYFRSSHDYESWVSALGAVLDASTLVITTIDDDRRGPAWLMYKVGVHLVEDLSHFFRLEHEHVVGIERFEFEDACRRLEGAGYRVVPPETAWDGFVKLRSEYAAPLNAIARLFEIPPAQWVGDRSFLPHPNERRPQNGRSNGSGASPPPPAGTAREAERPTASR